MDYHGGNSEKLVVKALQDGYRRKVKIATKLPPWIIKNNEGMDSILGKQLEKLQNKYIDSYLLYTLNKIYWFFFS